MLYNTAAASFSSNNPPLTSSPLVVPMGPLATAAFESGMSAVEELKLLKAQVQDVARVCNAVARGDLSQKITVPVQGVVMVQLKDVINTMVPSLVFSFPPTPLTSFSLPIPHLQRSTNSDNSRRKLLGYLKKLERKGMFYFLSHPSLPAHSQCISMEFKLAPLGGIIHDCMSLCG